MDIGVGGWILSPLRPGQHSLSEDCRVAMVKICDVVGNGMSFDISPLRPEQHDSDDSFWFSINGMPWDVVGIASPLTNYPVLPAFEMADDWKWPPYKSPHLLTVAFVGFHLSDQDDPI